MKRPYWRIRCWWFENCHWLPWNWIPRRAYQICSRFLGPGYVVIGRQLAEFDLAMERDMDEAEHSEDWFLKPLWISPHRLQMNGEFAGW